MFEDPPKKVRLTYTTAELDELVEEYVASRKKSEEIKITLTDANIEKSRAEHRVLDALKITKKKNYQVDGVGSVSHVEKYAVRTPKDPDEKRKFFAYLMAKGEDTYLTLATVNYAALNAFYNEETGQAERRGEVLSIPGIEEPTLAESVRFSKPKLVLKPKLRKQK